MSKHRWLVFSLLLVMGCQAGLPTGKPAARRPSVAPAASSGPNGPVQPSGSAGPLAPRGITEPPRIVPQVGTPVQLAGKVSLISDKGSGVLSNNAGSLISDNGGGLISGNTGSLVSNNGSGIAGKTKLRVLEAGKVAEALLADAQIEVLDGAGQVLVAPDGTPLTATTDGSGNYTLKAVLPAENLLLRVRLNVDPAHPGGELRAILPRSAARSAEALDLDTASSFGATYLLEKYVQKRQAVYDRLPANEAVSLRDDLEAARLAETPDALPDYAPAEMVKQVDALRARVVTLDQTLERIKAILLAGQENLGNGRQATDVPLIVPVGAVGDAAGNLYVAEGFGRIRKIDPQGVLTTFAGEPGLPGDQATRMAFVGSLAPGPDGSLYFCERLANVVRRFDLSDPAHPRLVLVAGNGNDSTSGSEGPATAAGLSYPTSLAFAPDGNLYIGESPSELDQVGRILRVDPAGILHVVPSPEAFWQHGQVAGLAVTADGTLYALQSRAGKLAKRGADGAWSVIADGLKTSEISRLCAGPAGEIYVSESQANRVLVFTPDGSRQVLAGTGAAGFSGDGAPAAAAALSLPGGLWRSPQNQLYIADSGNGKIRAVALAEAGQPIRTVAGSQGIQQQGDALEVGINGPGGIAVDGQGRLVVSEGGSSTIKRLEDQLVTVIAGTSAGFSGDGAAAEAAQLSAPAGIAFDGDQLYVSDNSNHRIRRIDFGQPGHPISTVAGSGAAGAIGAPSVRAGAASLNAPFALAVGPDHQVAIADSGNQVVLRLLASGQVERVAGSVTAESGDFGDNGPADRSLLSNPFCVAYDAAGDLYIADTGNLRVRKVDLHAAGHPISTVAGIDGERLALRFMTGDTSTGDGGPATDAPLWAPCALTFGTDGAMYVAELGTQQFGSIVDFSDVPKESLPKVGARIRKIGKDGVISTIAGEGAPLLGDAGGDNSLRTPLAMVIDADGRLVIADSGLNQLKVLPKGSF